MSDTTKIEWADSTFNPWIGCAKVGPGCDHCYAEVSTPSRTLGVVWGPKAERHRTSAGNWKMPMRWEREHDVFFAQHGRRRRVFCASLADVFDNQAPPAWRAELFAMIAATPNLDWLLVTKRIGNVQAMLEAPGMQKCGLPANVWLGITLVNREEMLRDAPKLKAIEASVHFWSVEPLLGDLGAIPGDLMPGWVIVGGESGTKARPMHPDWARGLRDQCAAVGVPYLFKQWGEWLPWHHFGCARVEDPPEQTQFKTMEFVEGEWIDVGYPDCWVSKDGAIDDMQCVGRVGKKKAGRLLDGIEHNGFPEAA